jgi:hypothetical protein
VALPKEEEQPEPTPPTQQVMPQEEQEASFVVTPEMAYSVVIERTKIRLTGSQHIKAMAQ